MIKSILDLVRLIYRRLTPYPTFIVDIGVVAGGAGYAAEIEAAGRTLRINEVWFSKPSVQVTMRLIKAAAESTGGTPTGGTVVEMRGSGGVDSRVNLFTAAPTAGAAIGDVFEMVVATTDNVTVTFGDNGTEALEISGVQAFALNVSAAATIVGTIKYQEVSK